MRSEPLGGDSMQALRQFIAMRGDEWSMISGDESPALLDDNALHLVAMDLDGISDTALDSGLNAADLARGERILNIEKRRLYLGGRAGLKLLLARYTGISANRQNFLYGSRGKPALADHPMRFNYTLSRNKVLYAFSMDREVGIDMEVLPRLVNAAHMAKSRITEAERDAWETIPEACRNDAMLCCWTRKEAYGKAIGVGIRFRLGAVDLFKNLSRDHFATPLTGLLPGTSPADMPAQLHGVQIAPPFPAVASVMYGADPAAVPPTVSMMQFQP